MRTRPGAPINALSSRDDSAEAALGLGQSRLGHFLKRRGIGLAGDRRVFSRLQGPTVARTLTAALRLSGRLSKRAELGSGWVARLFGLASARDLEQLTKRLERLEADRKGGLGPGPASGSQRTRG